MIAEEDSLILESVVAPMHYNPHRAQTTIEQLNDYLHRPVDENLTSIPGIGKRTAMILSSIGDKPEFHSISTTYQLFGKFLMLRESGIDSKTQCERFYVYLMEKGAHENAHDIVRAVAEKANLLIPGIYDGTIYEPIGWTEEHIEHRHAHDEVPLEIRGGSV